MRNKRPGNLVFAGMLSFFMAVSYSGSMAMDKENSDVIREKLENGLTVIIKKNTAAPVAACNFWVRAGAGNENEREKGLSHFIEHMMFKGTEKRGVGEIDREIKEMGGYNNAFTSYDATNYVIVLPSEYVNRAIEIQYDALTSSVFEEKEIDKEREVILDELYKGQDNPNTVLWQRLMKQMFSTHYADPIIGYDTLIKGYTRKSLVDYYKKYYIPANMVVVISGDVDPDAVMKQVKATFGTIEPRKTGKLGRGAEPKEDFTYEAFPGKVQSRYLAVAFRIPDALSEDTPALEILSRLLGGSASSILYRSVKEEQELVDEIDAGIFSGRHGGVFVITAIVREGKYREALTAIFSEIRKVAERGVRPEEVSKVKSDLIREKQKEEMKVENAAMELGYYEALSDYALQEKYYDGLRRVIETDMKAMAGKYLRPLRAGISFYYPEKSASEFRKLMDAEAVKKLVAPEGEPAKKSVKEGPSMRTLGNGITLIHKKMDNADIVAVKFIFTGGVMYEGSAFGGAYRGITNLMQETMLKGTKKKDAAEVAENIDRLGVVLSKDISKDKFGWSAEMVSANFEPFMELFAEILLEPAFSLKEIKKEKENIINDLNRLKDSPAAYCMKIFNEEFFEWHPYGFYSAGSPETVKSIPAQRLSEWHDRYINSENLIISVAGNIDADYAAEITAKKLGAMKKGDKMKAGLPVKITRAKREIREKIDKNQSHVVIGFLGPKMGSEDYYSFRVLDTVLSGGMDSRLFSEIRDKKNLCYTIYSTFDRYVENGAFKIYAATSPENEKKLISEIFALLHELRDKGITEKELMTAKTYIGGMFRIGFQDYMSQAESYGMYEFWGMGYKRVDTFLDRINNVTKADVNDVIRRYIDLDRYTQVVAGPAK